MSSKKKTLPKNFEELIRAGDITALKEVFTQCELDARGGYYKQTALSYDNIPAELVRWLVDLGVDINTRDAYGQSPLYAQARSRFGNLNLLLELGADIEAPNHMGDTPLHAAAQSYNPNAVQELIAHGANVHATNKMNRTPLSNALACCQNNNIVNMVKVSELLLKAGAQKTSEMIESVNRIGKDFEFYRESFNKDRLQATENALFQLYKLYDVEPIEKRRTHDGISLITVTSANWQTQHQELWDYLVPAKGHALTIQGEVIRIAGRIAYEVLDNGGVNWDNDYRKMLDALIRYFGTGTSLNASLLQEVVTIAQRLCNGIGDDEPMRLCQLAVQWVLINPTPITLGQPNYSR